MQNQESLQFTPVEEIKESKLILPTEKDFEVALMGKVDERIAEVGKTLSKLLRADPSDKNAYKAIKDLRNKVIVKMRTNTDRKLDEMLAGVREYTSKSHEIAKEIKNKVKSKLEDKADAFLNKHEEIEEEKKNKKIREAQERLDSRLKELEQNGVFFNGQWYAINDISIGKQMLEEMNEEVYSDLLSKVKVQNGLNIQKAKAKAEADRLESERQENLRKENERQKAELEKMKADMELEKKKIADAKKEIRQSKLAPYIQFIRDCSLVLSMEDDEFEKEFESIKIGAQQHWDFEKKKEEAAKEAAIQKEKEEKAKKEKEESDRKLLAERAIPYEELGFKHNYTKGTWGISIGDFLALEISKDGLLDGAIKYDEVKKQVEEATSKEEARLAEVEKQKEEARIKLMNEKDAFNDYIVRLLNVQAPILENEQLKKSIISITSLFKTID